MSTLTRSDEIKGSVKIVLVHIAHHWHRLIADLFVGPKDDKKKPSACVALVAIAPVTKFTNLV
jgi:hypothetical protein